MKFLVLAVCVACAAALAVDKDAQIVSSNSEISPEGNFQHGFQADNGISESAVGVLKTIGKDEAALQITGENSYTDPEGNVISLKYVADEFGFHPEGAHLPTPPAPEPIPEYIQRSLEWAAAHPYVEEKP